MIPEQPQSIYRVKPFYSREENGGAENTRSSSKKDPS
jgi:hypothetical protein